MGERALEVAQRSSGDLAARHEAAGRRLVGTMDALREAEEREAGMAAALEQQRQHESALVADLHGARRQLYEQQLRSTRRTLTAVASHMLALDAARLNRDVVRVLRDGSDCVARAPVGFAYDVMDRLEDQHDETESLVDLMTERPLAVADVDVDEELAQLLTPPAPPCDDPGGECVVGGLPPVPGFEPASEKWTPSPYSFSEEAACAASPTPVS